MPLFDDLTLKQQNAYRAYIERAILAQIPIPANAIDWQGRGIGSLKIRFDRPHEFKATTTLVGALVNWTFTFRLPPDTAHFTVGLDLRKQALNAAHPS